MTKPKQIYKCMICGNIIGVVHDGAGQLVCCGQPMVLMEEKTQGEGAEKHVPVTQKTEFGFKVKVGSVPHPMEEAHHIEWIQASIDGEDVRRFLKPGEIAEAEFDDGVADLSLIIARAYCNVHGLWVKVGVL